MFLSFIEDSTTDSKMTVSLWTIFLILGIVAFLVYIFRLRR